MKDNIVYKPITINRRTVMSIDDIPKHGAYVVTILRLNNKLYIVDNLYHRVGGPAVIYASGDREWWLHGRRYYLQKDYWVALIEQGYEIEKNPEAITALI